MNKKNIILQTIVFAFLCILSFAEEKQKPNVVFIIVDDLNDWIGVMVDTRKLKLRIWIHWQKMESCSPMPTATLPSVGLPGEVFCMVFIRRVLAGISTVQKECLFMGINRLRGSLHPMHQRTLSFFTNILRNMDTEW